MSSLTKKHFAITFDLQSMRANMYAETLEQAVAELQAALESLAVYVYDDDVIYDSGVLNIGAVKEIGESNE